MHLISPVFKAKNIVDKVDTLNFSMRDSKHDFLYKTPKPLVTGLVKKQIQKAIKDAITARMGRCGYIEKAVQRRRLTAVP